jgi:hypothetical protein
MQSGYVFTEDGQAALGAFGVSGVRYAAALDDGSGLIAFDMEPENLNGFMELATMLGDVHLTREPILDRDEVPEGVDPQTVPDWYRKAAPKRAFAQGDEVFALTIGDESFERYLHEQESVSGCIRIEGRGLLVESHGPVMAGGAQWVAAVVEYRQAPIREGASA